MHLLHAACDAASNEKCSQWTNQPSLSLFRLPPSPSLDLFGRAGTEGSTRVAVTRTNAPTVIGTRHEELVAFLVVLSRTTRTALDALGSALTPWPRCRLPSRHSARPPRLKSCPHSVPASSPSYFLSSGPDLGAQVRMAQSES